MEKHWDLNDILFLVFFTILSCAIMTFMAKDFAGIITDLWYGFGNVMVEFGRVVEQLPI